MLTWTKLLMQEEWRVTWEVYCDSLTPYKGLKVTAGTVSVGSGSRRVENGPGQLLQCACLARSTIGYLPNSTSYYKDLCR